MLKSLIVLLVLVQYTLAAMDPDVYLNVSSIIRAKGYPCEEHDIITEDGYILSAQRIPFGKSGNINANTTKKAVYLQHGLVCSTAVWVASYLDSFPYILADNGYDVWMVNSRNRPVPRHVTLQPTDPRMWQWSFDEMGKYDVAAAVEYILNTTKLPSVSAYVGHSQGGTLGWIAFSTYPKTAAKVDLFVSLGGPAGPPVINSTAENVETENNVKSVVCPKCPEDWPGCCAGNFGLETGNKWSPDLCNELKPLCAEAICASVGCESARSYNDSRLPVFLSKWPTYTSLQNDEHWEQVAKGFKMYDYGNATANFEHYNSTTPPPYLVSNLMVRTAIFYGSKDKLCSASVTDAYLPLLPKNLVALAKELPYGHLDWIANDKTGYDLLYKPIMDLIL